MPQASHHMVQAQPWKTQVLRHNEAAHHPDQVNVPKVYVLKFPNQWIQQLDWHPEALPAQTVGAKNLQEPVNQTGSVVL